MTNIIMGAIIIVLGCMMAEIGIRKVLVSRSERIDGVALSFLGLWTFGVGGVFIKMGIFG